MKKFIYLFVVLTFFMLGSCKKNKFEVKFIGFNETVLETKIVTKNTELEYPTVPEVDGYTFIEWSDNLKYVEKDTVIKTIYQINQYNVKFYNDLNQVIDQKIVNFAESCSAPTAPLKEGYKFIGWDQELSSIKNNLDVYPVYEQLTFTVNFFDFDNNIISTNQVLYGQSPISPTNPTKEGYKFIGWDHDFNNIKSNLDIKPIFEQLKFTVNFYDSFNNIIKTEQVLYGENVIAPTSPTKEGHQFIGWDQEFNNVKDNLNIRPMFEKNKYIVNFYDANDIIIKTEQVPYGETCNAPSDPVKKGYKFITWDQDFSKVMSNLDIRPVFDILTFIVKFYDFDGNVIKTENVLYGESAIGIEAPFIDGLRFLRWDEDYSEVITNLNVHPIYEELVYTVTFVDFYGNVLKTEVVYENESATAPNVPNIDYHTFIKWDLDFSEVKNNMTIKAVYTYNHTSYDISNVNYWLQILSKKYDINKSILSRPEIANYNEKIVSDYSKTVVMDVLSIKGSKTSSYVLSLINAYTNINKYTIFNKDTNNSISSTEKDNILSNRNLYNIPSTVTVKYGIISEFAWMRSYPTNHYSNDYYMDRFQETSLNVGEGVAIYHESSDKEWYFVQAENYNGWVEKKYIAECTYDEMESFLKPEKNLLVISDYVTLENSHVRMGQSFPLINASDDSYTIKFPIRNNDGSLLLKELIVSKSNDYNEGYLDYNYKNIFTQAFKLLGIDYSWGDKDKLGRDCSSTMNAIYKCFGFMMPRNTSNQVAIPSYGAKISGLTNYTIQNYKPGSLIFTSSHVMLYIGVNENGIAYLLHNTTSGDGACILQSLNDYGGSRINGVLKLQ